MTKILAASYHGVSELEIFSLGRSVQLDVVKSTVFLTNLADFAGMNEVYARFFTADFPARSTIQVAALPKGASVEIEVVAHY